MTPLSIGKQVRMALIKKASVFFRRADWVAGRCVCSHGIDRECHLRVMFPVACAAGQQCGGYRHPE
ncbi:hypothetical protein HTY54_27205 [Escherichia coli]|nr:hypothetical protein [Escherichia coli]